MNSGISSEVRFLNHPKTAEEAYSKICESLGGKEEGRGWKAHCPCPDHDDKNPSLSINIEEGKLLAHCFGGCTQESVVEELRTRGLWPSHTRRGLQEAFTDLKTSWEAARRQPRVRPGFSKEARPETPNGVLKKVEGLERAQGIYEESGSTEPTVRLECLGRYFAGRGLDGGNIPDVLRYTPNLKHPEGSEHPAMVAQITGPDGPLGISRTYLTEDCSEKALLTPQKAVLGPISGGSVRLGPLSDHILVGEGVETCLAVQQVMGITAWATLGAQHMPRLEIPSEVRTVTILADKDENNIGLVAALKSAVVYSELGCESRIAIPQIGKDFNETLQSPGGSEQIKKSILEAKTYEEYILSNIVNGQIKCLDKYILDFLVFLNERNDAAAQHLLSGIGSLRSKNCSTKSLRKKFNERLKMSKKEFNESNNNNNKLKSYFDFGNQYIETFFTEDEKKYFAIHTEQGIEYHRPGSQHLLDWVMGIYREEFGVIPLKDIQETLSNIGSQTEVTPRRVYKNIGFYEGKVYWCLNHKPLRVVELSPEGWRVINTSPIPFFWDFNLNLPNPKEVGDATSLLQVLNIKNKDDLELVFLSLLAPFQEKGTYPILALHGEQGSAKTTASKFLGRLIYGNSVTTSVLPKEGSDLSALLDNEPILIFDNVTIIPAELSDMLCGVSTGTSFRTRRLFTNSELHVVKAKKPIILNGISDTVKKSDLADRTLFVELNPIPDDQRKTESELEEKFEEIHPQVLGALCGMVVKGLATRPTTSYGKLPRLADSVAWVASCHGLRTQEEYANHPLAKALEKSSDKGRETTLEADSYAAFLCDSITQGKFPLSQSGVWERSSRDLFDELTTLFKGDQDIPKQLPFDWPKSVQASTKRLKQSASDLRKEGIEYTKSKNKSGSWSKIQYTAPNRPLDPSGEVIPPPNGSPDLTGKVTPPSNRSPDLSGEVIPPPNGASDLSGEVTSPPDEALNAPTSRNLGGFEKVQKEYLCITKEEDFENVLTRLSASDLIALDTETTGKDPFRADLVGISLSIKPNEAFYIPLSHNYPDAPTQLSKDWVIEKLKTVLGSPQIRKVGHNIKYDLHILNNEGIMLDGVLEDTMVQAYVLFNNLVGLSLKILAARILNEEMEEFETVVKGRTFSQIPLDEATSYAAKDADVTLRLYNYLLSKLGKNPDFQNLYEKIDRPLIPVLTRMEREGMYVDADLLKRYQRDLNPPKEKLIGKLKSFAGDDFNPNSLKQVSKLLYEDLGYPITFLTNKGDPSTKEEALESLIPLKPRKSSGVTENYPEIILRIRGLNARETLIEKLLEAKHPKTGRIHSSINQTKVLTGRLSVSKPPLQGIPKGKDKGIRSAFTARPGYRIVSADYSQVELRVLAHCSGDVNLISAFREGKDVHTETAGKIFQKPVSEVDEKERSAVKEINFGVVYGIGSYQLSRKLNIDEQEAQRYIDNYYQEHPGVQSYKLNYAKESTETGCSTIMSGRKRVIKGLEVDINCSLLYRSYRQAFNTAIQGLAAEIIKLAMISLDEGLSKHFPKARMLLQIHDELVFEVPESESSSIKDYISKEMENAFSKLEDTFKVPLKVDLKEGYSWGEVE